MTGLKPKSSGAGYDLSANCATPLLHSRTWLGSSCTWFQIDSTTKEAVQVSYIRYVEEGGYAHPPVEELEGLIGVSGVPFEETLTEIQSYNWSK